MYKRWTVVGQTVNCHILLFSHFYNISPHFHHFKPFSTVYAGRRLQAFAGAWHSQARIFLLVIKYDMSEDANRQDLPHLPTPRSYYTFHLVQVGSKPRLRGEEGGGGGGTLTPVSNFTGIFLHGPVSQILDPFLCDVGWAGSGFVSHLLDRSWKDTG